ncbi:Hypothetical predicted protein [Octopus vulgaris]|uniref:Uncharacterized protein n=1 Tax=Octopus vulgaris TaxID=6645 RepID=A0AA36B6J4_OCTVU|nr:Hypothetical predicted protein [Octopus vulgaris]
MYVKPLNIIFARYLLMTCKQEPGQSVDDYLQKLKRLAKDCGYRAVDAETHKNEAVRDAFISGLTSSLTRLRLLENIQDAAITLEAIFNQARPLEVAQRNSEVYNSSQSAINSQGSCLSTFIPREEDKISIPDGNTPCTATKRTQKSCTFCGSNEFHPSTTRIRLLGYEIQNGNLKPNPDRVKPLLELPIPSTHKALSRIVGLFAYYSKWIPKFSDMIKTVG